MEETGPAGPAHGVWRGDEECRQSLPERKRRRTLPEQQCFPTGSSLRVNQDWNFPHNLTSKINTEAAENWCADNIKVLSAKNWNERNK